MTYQVNVGYEDTLGFIMDGNKFLQNFAGIIDVSMPHLYLSALPFAPCKSILATSLVSQFPKIARVAVGQCEDWPTNQLVLQSHTSSVNSVAFSPDGRHIVSGSRDQTIRVWDAQTGGQVGNLLQGHTDSVNSVAFSPDGRHIVSGSRDQTIQISDTQTDGQVRNPLQGHTDSVKSVAFPPDGRHIVSGSEDQTIQVWDAQTLDVQEGHLFQGHAPSVSPVSFPPDGSHIVSGSDNQTIQVLDAYPTGQLPKPLDSLKRSTLNFWQSVSPIHFSSQGVHALQDAQSLFMNGTSHFTGDWRDFIHLQKNGWIIGPNGKLVLWVPPSYHALAFYSPRTRLVIPRGIPELDLSKMVHGTNWHKCYLPN